MNSWETLLDIYNIHFHFPGLWSKDFISLIGSNLNIAQIPLSLPTIIKRLQGQFASRIIALYCEPRYISSLIYNQLRLIPQKKNVFGKKTIMQSGSFFGNDGKTFFYAPNAPAWRQICGTYIFKSLRKESQCKLESIFFSIFYWMNFSMKSRNKLTYITRTMGSRYKNS